MIPMAISITLIVIVGMGLIMQQESQSVAITQKASNVDTLHNIKEKETILAFHSGNTFSFKNPENVPVNIKYFRILDNNGNLIARIPYTQKIASFTNSSMNLGSVIPSQYLN
jgi:hypothetical protein